MLSFFSSPDLRKFRGKQKKSEPSVKLKHVLWNNSELTLENEIFDKKPPSHTDSIDSIVLLRQHSSLGSSTLNTNNTRDSEDSWVSQQGSSGAFWFLRNRHHDKFLGTENLKQSKSSIDESEEYLDTEEESIYATKSDFNTSIYTVSDNKTEGEDEEPDYLTMASLMTIIDKENVSSDESKEEEGGESPQSLESEDKTETELEAGGNGGDGGEAMSFSADNSLESWEVLEDKMVSRRAILSRSRDDLAGDVQADMFSSPPEDQWFSKEKLYKDHIVEVLSKWDSIDDEIWAKVIVLERNRRIAKAYARAPVLTVNGSEEGFDGFRIGVNGFENPLRDNKTEEFKEQIGKGCKLKMDDSGNILVKRLSRSNIYVKNTMEENAVSNDILKLPNGVLEFEKPFKLFDMKKFQQNVNRELKRQYPERLKLETQCISTIAMVKSEAEVLDCPVWLMLINVVALEMLKAKLPHSLAGPQKGLLSSFHSNRVSSDEDPYSLSPAESSGSSGQGLRNSRREESGERKDKEYFPPKHWAVRGDLAEGGGGGYHHHRARSKNPDRQRYQQEDPYYHGLSARVPVFPVSKQDKESHNYSEASRLKSPSRGVAQLPGPGPSAWWHSRLYQETETVKGHDVKSKQARNRVASPSRPGFFRTSWK